MLFKMRRNHTREAYLNLVQKMKNMIPTLTLSKDLICGFCGETEEQFRDVIFWYYVELEFVGDCEV